MPRRRVVLWFVAVCALWSALPGRPAAAPGPLPPSGAERALAGGAAHAYTVDLRADDLLRLAIEQLGIDVEVRLVDAAGRPLLRVDSPSGDKGTEELLFIAASPGRYRIEVAPWEAGAAGRYRVTGLEIRRPTAVDRRRAAALFSFHRARNLGSAPGVVEEAAAGFRAAARLWGELGDERGRLEAKRRLADLLLAARRLREAAAVYGEILPGYRRAGDFHGQALAENNLGRCHQELGQTEPARAAFERALAAFRAAGEPGGTATALHNLGEWYRRQGDFRKALELFSAEWGTTSNPVLRAEADTSIGLVLAEVGQGDAADEYFEEALARLRRPGDASARAVALAQLANRIVDRGEPRRALLPLSLSLGLRRKHRDRRGEGVTLASLGRVYYQLGELDRAADLQRRALEILTEVGDKQEQAAAWSNFGWIVLQQGRPADALRTFEHALPLARGLKSRETEAMTLYGIARAERRRGNPIAARQRAVEALALIDRLRDDLGRRDLQLAFFEKMEGCYSFLIDLLMEQHRARPTAGSDLEALELSERTRSRVLLSRLGLPTGPPPAGLSLRAIQRELLDDDTLLLEYFLSEPRSYLWVVSTGSVASFELPGRAALEEQVRRVLAAVSHRGTRQEVAKLRLTELGRSLLAPVGNRLGDKRLVIVPHEFLVAVPFSALAEPGAAAPGNYSPLVLRHELVVAPSASVLSALRRREAARSPTGKGLAVLAAPVIAENDSHLSRGVPRPPGPLEGGDLAPLPSTASEAAAIRGLAPPGAVRLFLGFDASRTLVTSGALESFRTLHFATHGLFNEEQPESSAIVLSRFDREGRPIGGLLRAADIEKLRLRAELVVLSACQTALGRQTRGEGMVGLTQSFFAAGADRVLVSLWKVDDRATALLMASFYRKLLRNGRTPPAALREAQLAMWRQKRSPYQWAGFLLQGDWNWKDFPF